MFYDSDTSTSNCDFFFFWSKVNDNDYRIKRFSYDEKKNNTNRHVIIIYNDVEFDGEKKDNFFFCIVIFRYHLVGAHAQPDKAATVHVL